MHTPQVIKALVLQLKHETRPLHLVQARSARVITTFEALLQATYLDEPQCVRRNELSLHGFREPRDGAGMEYLGCSLQYNEWVGRSR